MKELWRSVDEGGAFDLAATPLWEKVKNFGFVSGTSNHADRIATIRKIYEQYGTLVDPHTADGLKVGLEHREPGVPLICLETALPVKFSESIIEAIGQEPARPAGYENIESMPQRYVVMNADADAINAFLPSRLDRVASSDLRNRLQKRLAGHISLLFRPINNCFTANRKIRKSALTQSLFRAFFKPDRL